jgi:hypothetical protein
MENNEIEGKGFMKNLGETPKKITGGPTLDDFGDMVRSILKKHEEENPRQLYALMCEDGEWKPIEQTRMFDEAMKKEAQKYLNKNEDERSI